MSVQSAKWRDDYFKDTLDQTDHLNELGWSEVSQLLKDETPDELLQRIHDFYKTVAKDLP